MASDHTLALSSALQRLARAPQLRQVAAYLDTQQDAIHAELKAVVGEQIPAFFQSRNPAVLPELDQHARDHVAEIVRLLRGGKVSGFAFVEAHASRRATEHFPLEAVLHAYRCGHKVFAHWIREASLQASTQENSRQIVADIADFAIDYTDAVSTVATSHYVAQVRLSAEVAGDKRSRLLSILLDGYDESDGRVAKILGDAGYLAQRQAFCVTLAQSVDPGEMLNPARARRLADSIDQVLEKSALQRLIDLRDNTVVIVFSRVQRASGWTEPRASLAQQVADQLATVGNAALIGVSKDVLSTSQIPVAHQQAKLALQLANVAHRVKRYGDIPLPQILLHLVADNLQPLLPDWTGSFLKADAKAAGALFATLQAYAHTNMNLQKAALHLAVHPNTLYARLQRIADITGVDAKSYRGLTELLLVIESTRDQD